jgi:hypothetical protein
MVGTGRKRLKRVFVPRGTATAPQQIVFHVEQCLLFRLLSDEGTDCRMIGSTLKAVFAHNFPQ